MSARNRSPLLSTASLQDAAEFLRVLGHPTRLRIVELLLDGSYCVGELAQACGVPSHVASEHLRLMQHCGLLRNERQGRKSYYQIVDSQLADILSCIQSRYRDNRQGVTK